MRADVYCRAAKPKFATVPHYEEVAKPVFNKLSMVTVDSSTECHVTPDLISDRLVSIALEEGAVLTSEWCDPQSGTGQLVNAMIKSGVSSVTAIERHYKLVDVLRRRFSDTGKVTVLNDDCFEVAQTFDVIIANHPFKKISHFFKDSMTKLNKGGIYVGIVPNTFSHPDAIDVEYLDKDVFETVKIFTKIILVKKPL